MKVLPLPCTRVDLRVARMTIRKMAAPSPVGDEKTVPSISIFVQNTSTFK